MINLQQNNEIWKDIDWYEWLYQVSNFGRVRSLHCRIWWKEIIRKLWHRSWYAILILHKKWKVKCELVHRLVGKAFLPNTENKFCINHKNWIRDDNCVENLEWCTTSENAKHSFRELWRHVQKSSEHVSSRSVKQYSLFWKFIKEWPSMMDIQRDTKFCNSHIWKVCMWKRKTAYWYIWKYS
jgi:hypothetical protein